ncbi:MAG: response regulator transcription factor [Oscillospiraceae bacterium]|nr:response regulator transcription factor [Oscillospiraceae bacterium]
MKLLIVDDDALIRDSLQILFENKEPDWSVYTAENGLVAFELCKQDETVPDVILMDIRMPVMDGIEATKKIKSDFQNVRIVMLTTFSDEGYIASAIKGGADGYLLKSTPADGIIERIRAVQKGALVFDKGVKLNSAVELCGAKELPERHFTELTERENEILSLIATGLSNNEIAAKLFLSQGTVRNAVSQILEKLGLRDRTQLAVHYWRGNT